MKNTSNLINVRCPKNYNFVEGYDWCKNNCIDKFYASSDWDNWVVGETNIMIQFVSERDASLFALRWL